jgi:Sulfotransferase family
MLVEPTFIMGHSRSGTTLLQRCLERSEDLWVLGREGKPIWESLFHPMLRGWSSNALNEADATPSVVERLHAMFLESCIRPTEQWDDEKVVRFLRWVQSHGVNPYYYGQRLDLVRPCFPNDEPYGPPSNLERDLVAEIPPFSLPPLGVRRPTPTQIREGLRMVEKSTQSPCRIPFINRVFPDARFLIVVRDGRESVSSNIEAWKDPHCYFSYRLPVELRIKGYSDRFPWGRHWWNNSLQPGWPEVLELGLEEVCAHAWIRNNEEMLRWYPILAEQGRAMIVRYEELVRGATAVLAGICEFIGIPAKADVVSEVLPFVPGGTAPKGGKWRENLDEIGRVMSLIAPMQARLGYPESLEG